MSPIFSFLKEKELILVDQNKFTVMFKKGETIRKQGTFMTHVLSVNSGLAKLYLEGVGFRNAIIRIVKPTNFIGGPGIYLDKMHHYSITAIQDTVVCFIDLNVFKKIIDANKAFSREFMKDFSRNILSVYSRLISLTQKHTIGRVADTLIYLFNEIFESSSFPSEITKQDIADLSAMSKESVIQVLRQFQKEEIIAISKDKITLLSEEKLIMMSNFC